MAITVTLSDQLSERVREAAQVQQQSIIDVVETMLDRALNEQINDKIIAESIAEAEADLEMQAYIDLHPQLKTTYFGQYVAIYGGQLVDHDADHAALYERIDARYPDEYVWISKVEEEPIQTLRFLSPRIEMSFAQ